MWVLSVWLWFDGDGVSRGGVDGSVVGYIWDREGSWGTAWYGTGYFIIVCSPGFEVRCFCFSFSFFEI